jgi:mevalonate kinase
VLYGDNSFYSFRNINNIENKFENLNNMNKKFDKNKNINITQKTGLGSSSAFSVCISSALYLVSEILPFQYPF